MPCVLGRDEADVSKNTPWHCFLHDRWALGTAWKIPGWGNIPGEVHSLPRDRQLPKPSFTGALLPQPTHKPRSPSASHSHTHMCTDTHRHALTLFPSFGQETAQCSEAPFSIFVVMSAWLLREGGRTKGQLREQEGAQGSTRQGGGVAEQCRKMSGCHSPGLG